jgi:hypothetical protein
MMEDATPDRGITDPALLDIFVRLDMGDYDNVNDFVRELNAQIAGITGTAIEDFMRYKGIS